MADREAERHNGKSGSGGLHDDIMIHQLRTLRVSIDIMFLTIMFHSSTTKYVCVSNRGMPTIVRSPNGVSELEADYPCLFVTFPL
jgi:hypothetical protein